MKVIKPYKFGPIKAYKFGYSPAILGKPKLLVYVYFIDGLLIDTGQPRMRKEVLETVKDLPVKQIFVTHHHEDHSGNAPLLKAHFNCPVYAPPLCVEMMKNPPPISLAQKIFWGDRPPNRNLIVKEKVIQTPNYKFELIDIPGHAADMVALYEAEQKWLFSADLYVNSYIGYFLKNESVAQQIASTKKVLTLDFDVLFCAHNPQLEQARTQLEKKLSFLENFYSSVAELYDQNPQAYSPQQILKKLQLKEFWFVRLISLGQLSKLNMVRSVIRDEEQKKRTNIK